MIGLAAVTLARASFYYRPLLIIAEATARASNPQYQTTTNGTESSMQ